MAATGKAPKSYLITDNFWVAASLSPLNNTQLYKPVGKFDRDRLKLFLPSKQNKAAVSPTFCPTKL